jgi:hypothetical protein
MGSMQSTCPAPSSPPAAPSAPQTLATTTVRPTLARERSATPPLQHRLQAPIRAPPTRMNSSATQALPASRVRHVQEAPPAPPSGNTSPTDPVPRCRHPDRPPLCTLNEIAASGPRTCPAENRTTGLRRPSRTTSESGVPPYPATSPVSWPRTTPPGPDRRFPPHCHAVWRSSPAQHLRPPPGHRSSPSAAYARATPPRSSRPPPPRHLRRRLPCTAPRPLLSADHAARSAPPAIGRPQPAGANRALLPPRLGRPATPTARGNLPSGPAPGLCRTQPRPTTTPPAAVARVCSPARPLQPASRPQPAARFRTLPVRSFSAPWQRRAAPSWRPDPAGDWAADKPVPHRYRGKNRSGMPGQGPFRGPVPHPDRPVYTLRVLHGSSLCAKSWGAGRLRVYAPARLRTPPTPCRAAESALASRHLSSLPAQRLGGFPQPRTIILECSQIHG